MTGMTGTGGMGKDGISLRDIQARLGVSRSLVSSMMAAGLVAPRRGERNAWFFSFQDVVLIRTAHSLRASRVPTARILHALRRLRDAEADRHLSCIHLSAVGRGLAVREGDRVRMVESGQYVMPFGDRGGRGAVVGLAGRPSRTSSTPPGSDLRQAFRDAYEAEHDTPGAAERAYRDIVAADPAFRDAYLNLGCLLAQQARPDEAIALYRDALRHLPDEPALHFNLGVALEDSGKPRDALACYRRSIELAPDDADAHFNAARLHQQLGDPQRAIRHFNDYRRLGGD